MSPIRILLRVLLCIGLILNGSGVAVAAIKMHMDHAPMTLQAAPPSATSPVAAMAGNCHEAPGMGTPGIQRPIVAVDDGTYTSASTQGAPDCCKASQCDDSCVQQVQATIATPIVGGPMGARDVGLNRMRMGHPSPALGHQIRPPIG